MLKKIFLSKFFFLLVISIFVYTAIFAQTKKITVIGTGYVGLVLGACLAENGHDIICIDIIHEKILRLNDGKMPIYEPDLEKIISDNTKAGRLKFLSDIPEGIKLSDILIIAVGTPANEDGSANISAVESVAQIIGKNISGYKTICIKSTVPIGTSRKIKDIISANISNDSHFDLVFCPEFLREGSAVKDFFHPDRLIIGGENLFAKEEIKSIFGNQQQISIPILETNFETAETIKYASNAFLATKISFINEFANLCDILGADILKVSEGMGLDKRIGADFLNPGPGFGGHGFPKDTLALFTQSKSVGINLNVVGGTIEANYDQKNRILLKLEDLLDNNLNGKTIAVLGLSFKANSDDVRSSPSIEVIQKILLKGGLVKAYDPVAMQNMKKIIPEISYCDSINKTTENCHAVVILTDWDEFKILDLNILKQNLYMPNIVDARNIFDPLELHKNGFNFHNVGRPLQAFNKNNVLN